LLKVTAALSEIAVGTITQLIIGVVAGSVLLAVDDSAIKLLSSATAIVFTFLAGAETPVCPTAWSSTCARSTLVAAAIGFGLRLRIVGGVIWLAEVLGACS
jgi:hypothetical protein